MFASQNHVVRQVRDRLQVTCMGLGLVRLLQDAKRFEEAKATLYSLENGFAGASNAPKQDGRRHSQRPRRRPARPGIQAKSA